MVLRGAGPGIAAFVRRHGEVVEKRPQTWFAIAVERWAADEVEAAAHWMDRILQHHQGDSPHDGEPVAGTASVLACVRLMRARLGLEPMAEAVDHAQRVVLASLHDGNQPHAVQSVSPQLLTELGATQNWLGDLTRAEANLSAAVATCRSRHLPALAAEATSHLAFTEYMAGKERAAVQVATEALATLGEGLPWRPRFAAHRASLVLLLAGLVDLPLPDAPIDPPEQPTPVHTADLCTRFWLRVREARLALTAGSVADTERILSTPLNVPVAPEQLPEHLQVALVVERAFLAALSSDQQALRGFEQQLRTRATGEAALVAGLRADLAGDRRGAAALFEEAADKTSYPQPASQALALSCQAQLLDALGEHDRALDRLREAARLTEVRRNAVPFLGWCRQGTPMQTLLTRLLEVTEPAPGAPSAAHEWVKGLAAAAAGKADIASMFAPVTPTVQERSAGAALVVPPTLSPREREVLNGLARGARYADIAANLFVSENTVKTHVSSLYGKLAVARRSDALAVARRLHLL
jgi:DNA-binding CsgD family transcriptional regulator